MLTKKAARVTGRPFLFWGLCFGALTLFALGAWLALAPQSPSRWWQAGPELPRLTGYVVDGAALLSDTDKKRLSIRLRTLEQRTGHQFVIVTVKTLAGETIENFGIRLGRSWGIGRKGVDDGLLLVVAPQEHQVRIEVGYGLERALTDPECARIIRNSIVPRFRNGDFSGGIDAGATAIAQEIS